MNEIMIMVRRSIDGIITRSSIHRHRNPSTSSIDVIDLHHPDRPPPPQYEPVVIEFLFFFYERRLHEVQCTKYSAQSAVDQRRCLSKWLRSNDLHLTTIILAGIQPRLELVDSIANGFTCSG